MPFKRIVVIAAILLVIAFLSRWSDYILREGRLLVGLSEAKPTESSALPTPRRVALVTPDMLHVSSISLGNPRLAVINRKQVTEGSSLKVETSSRTVVLRVVKIEDGIVHLKDGEGQTIDARLTAPTAQHSPPH